MLNPNSQLLKQARECQFYQGALRELARSLPLEDAPLDHLLADAVAAKDELAFLHLALAALEAGRKVDARHLVAGVGLLPQSTKLATVALHAAGDVCHALVEAAAKGGMRPEREAFVLLLAGAWCVAHRNRAFPPALLARARTLARQTDTNIVADIQLHSLADLLQDAGLSATIESHRSLKGQPPARLLVDDLLARDKASVFLEVPVESGPVALSGYTVRRAVPRLGRNDPCHCGSRKKYKQCCLTQDQQRMLRSSAVPGLTVEELRDNQEPYLTRRRLLEMRSYELARLDPAKVDAELLPALVDRLLNFADYEAAVSVFEKLGYRGELVDQWDASLYHTRHNGRADLVKRLARLRPDLKPEELNLDVRLLLMDETPNPALDLIEAEARQALREERPAALVDLAYDLLCSPYPGVGILAARGVFRLTNYLEAATLFDVLSETRDRLNLFAKEPYQEIVERMFYEETGSTPHDNPALAETHARLEEKSKEVRELQTRLEALHQELQNREKPPVAPPVQPAQPVPPPATPTPAPVEDPALSELRRRVASLREALKERHNERNQLRRDLQTAMEDLETLREKTGSEPADPAAETAEEEDQWLTAEEPAGIQPVRLPEFPKKFQDSLAALPKPVVRSAMALVGRLAAGDPAAFKGCRRLQMTHEIWRQRVGLHHRLLFRFQADALEVVALINRRDLERKIKSLA